MAFYRRPYAVCAAGEASFAASGTCVATQRQPEKRVSNQIFQDGSIHILVNNAGISQIGNLESSSEQDFGGFFCEC